MAGDKLTKRSTNGLPPSCLDRSRFALLYSMPVAVRLWFNRMRGLSAFIGLIAALAFIVTFTNSLGGIASRADKVQAQRSRILDARNEDRRELERLEQQLADLGNYAPTDQATVDATRRVADTATTAKERECGGGDPKQRGKLCREKEESERARHRRAAQGNHR